MRRRRRRSLTGRAALAAFGAAGLLWVWSQSWGPRLFLAIAAVSVAAVVIWADLLTRRRRRRRHELATLHGLLRLTPLEFEHAVADVLADLGFTDIEVTGKAGDLQADILAVDPEGASTIVQCKRYAPDRSVGSPVLQSFIGMARIHHDCDRAMLVTTGFFTAPAVDLAEEHDIELIDGPALAELSLELLSGPEGVAQTR